MKYGWKLVCIFNYYSQFCVFIFFGFVEFAFNFWKRLVFEITCFVLYQYIILSDCQESSANW